MNSLEIEILQILEAKYSKFYQLVRSDKKFSRDGKNSTSVRERNSDLSRSITEVQFYYFDTYEPRTSFGLTSI